MEFDFEYFKPHPTKDNCVVHDRYCTYQEFLDALVSYLKSIPYDDEYSIHDILDYISPDIHYKKMNTEIPEFRWIYSWVTRGTSEGFYFHIESYNVDKTTNLFLAKTLYGDIDTALKINNAICRFIIETMDK